MRSYLVILIVLLAGCSAKVSNPVPDTSSILEEISRLENKEDVLKYWSLHHWPIQAETRDFLVKAGFQIPDPTYYPFTERYGALIPLSNKYAETVVTVYLDAKGYVTYRMIEIKNFNQP